MRAGMREQREHLITRAPAARIDEIALTDTEPLLEEHEPLARMRAKLDLHRKHLEHRVVLDAHAEIDQPHGARPYPRRRATRAAGGAPVHARPPAADRRGDRVERAVAGA